MNSPTESPPVEVSICIANYNGVNIINKCINAIRTQQTDISIEIIIHDDASTDESVNYIRSNYPDIKLIYSHKNSGYCISNNRLVDSASGKYVLLLNNDAFLRPCALNYLYEYSESQNFKGILSLPQYNAINSELLDYGFDLDIFLNPMPRKKHIANDVSMVMGACLWINRNLWNELGGFPPYFESNVEDMYICLAAWYSGYTVRVLPKCGYDHKVGNSFGGGKISSSRLVTTTKRRSLSERNKNFIMCMFSPFPIIIIQLPLHIIVLVLEGILLSLISRKSYIWTKIYWPSILAIYTNKDNILSYRKNIQSKKFKSIKLFFRLIKFRMYKLHMLLKYGIPSIK